MWKGYQSKSVSPTQTKSTIQCVGSYSFSPSSPSWIACLSLSLDLPTGCLLILAAKFSTSGSSAVTSTSDSSSIIGVVLAFRAGCHSRSGDAQWFRFAPVDGGLRMPGNCTILTSGNPGSVPEVVPAGGNRARCFVVTAEEDEALNWPSSPKNDSSLSSSSIQSESSLLLESAPGFPTETPQVFVRVPAS